MQNKEISVLLMISNGHILERLSDFALNRYRLKHVTNLEEGRALARSSVPDIIFIHSVLLQHVSWDICTVLRNNEVTSHIPIILITTGGLGRHEPALCHADVALSVPFSKKELILAIQKVLSLKVQLLKRYPIFYKSDNAFTREQADLSQVLEQLLET